MPVLVYLETAVTFYLDVILAIHSHHRHLAQHIEHSQSFRLFIGLNVVAYAVDVLLDELLLCFDYDAFKLFVPCDGIILAFASVPLGQATNCC